MKSVILSTAVLFFSSLAWSANYDALAQQKLSITSPNSETTLEKTLGNLKAVLGYYQPKIDPSSKITSPMTIGGTANNPVVKVSIRKCVAIICKNVDLDAEFSVAETSGSCDRNFLLTGDLSRSSDTLADVYDSLEVTICYRKSANGQGTLDLSARARQSGRYSKGPIQQQIFQMLQSQIDPVVKAVNQSLDDNK